MLDTKGPRQGPHRESAPRRASQSSVKSWRANPKQQARRARPQRAKIPGVESEIQITKPADDPILNVTPVQRLNTAKMSNVSADLIWEVSRKLCQF